MVGERRWINMRITQDVIQQIPRAYAEAGMGLTSTIMINKTTTAELRLGNGNVMNPPTLCTIISGRKQKTVYYYSLNECVKALKTHKW